MTPKQAKLFLQALGAPVVHAEDSEEWVTCSCVLAPWTHKKGTDNNPSFAVHLKPGERPYYNCFTCGGGSLEDLIGTMELYKHNSPEKGKHVNIKIAREILDNADVEIVPLPDYSEFSNHHTQQFEEWPQHYIDSFMPWKYVQEAYTYLKSRGITGEQAERFNLRWDSKKGMIVSPYSNVYGKLAGARGRAVQGGKGMDGHYDYTWNGRNNAGLVWYNEKVLNYGEPVVVVEGQFDLYAVDKVYPVVMANLTALPKPQKMKKLAQAPMVILMNDNDETGQAANEKYIKYLKEYGTPYHVVEYPVIKDEKGELVKLDPDKMGSEWIRDQLKGLVEV